MAKKGPPKVHFWDLKMVFPRFAISGLCRGSAGSHAWAFWRARCITALGPFPILEVVFFNKLKDHPHPQ